MKINEIASTLRQRNISPAQLVSEEVSSSSRARFLRWPHGVKFNDLASHVAWDYSYNSPPKDGFVTGADRHKATSMASTMTRLTEQIKGEWDRYSFARNPHADVMFAHAINTAILLAEYDEAFANRELDEIFSGTYSDFFSRDVKQVFADNGVAIYRPPLLLDRTDQDHYLIGLLNYLYVVGKERESVELIDGRNREVDVYEYDPLLGPSVNNSLGTSMDDSVFLNRQELELTYKKLKEREDSIATWFRDPELAKQQDLVDVIDSGNLVKYDFKSMTPEEQLRVAIIFNRFKIASAFDPSSEFDRSEYRKALILHEAQHVEDYSNFFKPYTSRNLSIGSTMQSELRARTNEFNTDSVARMFSTSLYAYPTEQMKGDMGAFAAETAMFYILFNDAMNSPNKYMINVKAHPNVSVQAQVASQMYKMMFRHERCKEVLMPYVEQVNNIFITPQEIDQLSTPDPSSRIRQLHLAG